MKYILINNMDAFFLFHEDIASVYLFLAKSLINLFEKNLHKRSVFIYPPRSFSKKIFGTLSFRIIIYPFLHLH